MKIRNVTDRARVIAATAQIVGPGETVEVDDDLGKSLLEQPDRWGKPTTKNTVTSEES